MSDKNPIKFAQEVKREATKIAWPSRKETMMTTMMVFVMVLLTAIFFLIVDQSFASLIRLILGIGG